MIGDPAGGGAWSTRLYHKPLIHWLWWGALIMVAGGALSILSFGSALYAFSLIETAKVSALRETSVVIAALMGTFFLGEGLGRRRIAAAVVLAGGLVLMQFGG